VKSCHSLWGSPTSCIMCSRDFFSPNQETKILVLEANMHSIRENSRFLLSTSILLPPSYHPRILLTNSQHLTITHPSLSAQITSPNLYKPRPLPRHEPPLLLILQPPTLPAFSLPSVPQPPPLRPFPTRIPSLALPPPS